MHVTRTLMKLLVLQVLYATGHKLTQLQFIIMARIYRPCKLVAQYYYVEYVVSDVNARPLGIGMRVFTNPGTRVTRPFSQPRTPGF